MLEATRKRLAAAKRKKGLANQRADRFEKRFNDLRWFMFGIQNQIGYWHSIAMGEGYHARHPVEYRLRQIATHTKSIRELIQIKMKNLTDDDKRPPA